MNQIIFLFSLIIIFFILFTEPIIFTYTNYLLYIEISFIILYILQILIKAIIIQKEEAKLALFGTFVFLSALINDNLNNNLIIHTFNSLSIGLVIFIITQSYLILLHLSKAYQYSLQLSKELNYFNNNLENIVKDRTLQIQQAKEELEVQSENLKVANDEIIQMNQMLKGQSIELTKKNKALTDSINYAKFATRPFYLITKVFEKKF